MKVAISCPNCGQKGTIEYSIILLVVLSLLIIPGIIYAVVIYKKYKCPKCGCMRIATMPLKTVE